MKQLKSIFYFTILFILLAGSAFSQQRDLFNLALNEDEKATVEDIIEVTKNTSKESQEKLQEGLDLWRKLEDDFPNLSPALQQKINQLNASGLKSKLRGFQNQFKKFDSGLEYLENKKEKIDKVIHFYDRYVPDSENPFRSLEVLNNLFEDVESLLPKEQKYEYIKNTSAWLARIGIRYYKLAIGNALNGLKSIQKQIQNRAGNCIGYIGGDGTADKKNPKRKAFIDLNTGDIICYTGLRPKGGEIYTNTDGNNVYIWSTKKWTKFSCGLGDVENVFLMWKLANGEVISANNIIYWCNQRLGEFSKANARATMQFDKLSSLNYCRQYILNTLGKEIDYQRLMVTVKSNKKVFAAKYIFKKEGVRATTEMLTNLISDNILIEGYVKNENEKGIFYASVTINIDSKNFYARTNKYGYFKVLANLPRIDASKKELKIKVSASNYSDYEISTTLQEQCENLGVLVLKSNGKLSIYPTTSKINQGESVDFTVTYATEGEKTDVTSSALANPHFIALSEGTFTITATLNGLSANATVEVVGHGCKSNEIWDDVLKDCICQPGFERDENGECIKIDTSSNISLFPSIDITIAEINEMLNNADCANIADAVAKWDPVLKQVICTCTKEFYIWDASQKKCVPNIQAILANSNCSLWPNTEPKWDYETNEPYCDCMEGYKWNDDFTECLSEQEILVEQTDCSQYPNTHAVWDPVNKEVVCDCLPGYEWDANYTKCISKALASLQNTDCSMYPNTEPVWDPVSNEVYCDCSPGYEWNEEYTACEKIQEETVQYDCSHLPNTRPIFDPVLNETVCDCMPGYQWNRNQTGCIPIPRKPTVDWGSIINMTMDILNTVNGNNQGISTQSLGTSSSTGLPQSMKPPVHHQSKCNDQQQAGGDAPEEHTIDLGQSFGSFMFDYNTVSQKDQIIVTNGGVTIFNSGCVGESKSIRLELRGYSPTITVRVNPNCEGGSGTQWYFTVHCPNN